MICADYIEGFPIWLCLVYPILDVDQTKTPVIVINLFSSQSKSQLLRIKYTKFIGNAIVLFYLFAVYKNVRTNPAQLIMAFTALRK